MSLFDNPIILLNFQLLLEMLYRIGKLEIIMLGC